VLHDVYHARPTYLFARTDEEVAVIARMRSARWRMSMALSLTLAP
jgi:hypothetical protein